MANGDSTSKFPQPYIQSIREDDPILHRVDQDMSAIGTTSAVMKDLKLGDNKMSIDHVGTGV